ncbi:GNAT family N-acetyltransferase [Microbacterium bovistercoris]|uniref:GNAT family N-acetyltransferase n=1 Tax=Microbacterium bovistercoris TaxID=2293570 RepID=A0A371NVF2_9MICO|nr:GNAT family N-acetyltransferase [Microbacterium bovistercoris]REJ06562.1 GNAT family N-acetyltransferase [Microbacterium bovistercoris]
MTLIDARSIPADPLSATRLEEAGFDYRLVGMDDPVAAGAFTQAVNRGFLGPAATDDEITWTAETWKARRNVGVYETGAAADALPVATLNSWVAPATVPGGQIPMWAISVVTVAATHRRRGIARNLLEGELRAAVATGVPIAGLTVSEATIYGRYGFGAAIPAARIAIDTGRAGWAGPREEGRLEYVAGEQLASDLGEVHERSRANRSGQIPGWETRWKTMAGLAAEEGKKNAGARGVRYLDADGELRGVMAYSMADQPGTFRSVLKIAHLAAQTDEAMRALWGFAVNHDLVTRVEVDLRPIDDPIVHLVADQRAVELTVHDHGWLRILDVPAALEARRYEGPAEAVVQVEDQYGFAAGTWQVRIGADGVASVLPSDADPDVTLGVADLSAAYAGGVPLAQLAAAGRVRGDARVIGALSRALRSGRAPLLGIWY